MGEHKKQLKSFRTQKITSYDLKVIGYKNMANIRIFYTQYDQVNN